MLNCAHFLSNYEILFQSDIVKALSTVEDPDLKHDLVSLNMIKDIKCARKESQFYGGSDHTCLSAERKNPSGL